MKAFRNVAIVFVVAGLIAFVCAEALGVEALGSRLDIRPPAGAPVVRPVPAVIDYVVAGPRAALAVHPPIIPAEALAADVLPPVIGAAHNFARPDGQATLRLGSTLRVRLSREIEGVWYPRACGWLGTLLILDCQVPATDSVSAEPVWKEIGRDGAAALRCGPSIGRARDVSVPFFPRRPGLYVLRARIYTYALPTPVADDAAPPSAEDMLSGEFGVVARDVVHIKVRVIWWNGELIPEDAEPVEEMPKENLAGVVE